MRRALLVFVAAACWATAAQANELCVWEVDHTGACVCVPIPCPLDICPPGPVIVHAPGVETPYGGVPSVHVGPPPDRHPCAYVEI
jgi:hypothetical protein